MKKTAIILLVVAVALSVVGPAEAGKKKKKKKLKPYTSDEVTIQLGHAAFYTASGTLLTVTAQEFLNTCAVPNSNGLDAYVFEVPEPYQKVTSIIEAVGSGSTTGHDLDIYLFDASCASKGVFNSTSHDETGLVAPDTAFILLHNYGAASEQGGGDPVTAHYTLRPR